MVGMGYSLPHEGASLLIQPMAYHTKGPKKRERVGGTWLEWKSQDTRLQWAVRVLEITALPQLPGQENTVAGERGSPNPKFWQGLQSQMGVLDCPVGTKPPPVSPSPGGFNVYGK